MYTLIKKYSFINTRSSYTMCRWLSIFRMNVMYVCTVQVWIN